MKFKKLIIGGLLISTMTMVTGCYIDGSEEDMLRQQRQVTREGNKNVGVPNIENFTEKNMVKKILELRDKPNLTTYAYSQNKEGQYVYLSQCVGFGVPASVQYTDDDYPDPNGLYMPEGLSATYLMAVNEETGKHEPIYFEPEVIVVPYKLPKRLCAEWSLPEGY